MLAKKIQSEMEDEDGDEAEVEEQDELSDEDDVVDPSSDEEGGPVSEEDEVSDEDGEEVELSIIICSIIRFCPLGISERICENTKPEFIIIKQNIVSKICFFFI